MWIGKLRPWVWAQKRVEKAQGRRGQENLREKEDARIQQKNGDTRKGSKGCWKH